MYVSYGLGVGLSIMLFLITFYLLEMGLKNSFIAIIVMLVVLMPLIARISRNIWINFFVPYNPDSVNTKT
jgi:hypothetical protein